MLTSSTCILKKKSKIGDMQIYCMFSQRLKRRLCKFYFRLERRGVFQVLNSQTWPQIILISFEDAF